jgi:hypothetical protein
LGKGLQDIFWIFSTLSPYLMDTNHLVTDNFGFSQELQGHQAAFATKIFGSYKHSGRPIRHHRRGFSHTRILGTLSGEARSRGKYR